MPNFINGDLAILSIRRAGQMVPIACLTSNGLAEALTFNEVQTKCDPGVIITTPNAYSYTVPLEGVLTDTTSVGGDTALASWDYLRTLMRTKTQVEWQIVIGDPAFITDGGFGYFENLEMTAPVGENITFTGTIRGTGDITTTT